MPPPEQTNDPSPSTDVLAERIRGVAAQLAGVAARMDGLATEKTMIDLMASRDREFLTHVNGLRDDIRDLVKALANERTERISADAANEERVNRARTFALAALGLGATFLFGLLGLIVSLGQGGGFG